jgi:N-acetylglucosamine kinase-like BadF-type ATPase
MKLIIESGSTKSDWVLIDNGKVSNKYKTMGYNPFFHNETIIYNSINQNREIELISKDVKEVFFYGAGCSSPDLNKVVHNAFQKVFTKAIVNIDHDLLACALATYEGEPSISCILGTGSNSCLFDGNDLSEAVPALGYILGDEGSGSYYGKKLLTDFLYGKLPEDIQNDFETEFKLTKADIFDNTYMKPHANVFLASFMRFISKYTEHPYVDDMLKSGMKHFMQNHVCCYKDYKAMKVHFIGSMSYIFKNQLEHAAQELGIQTGMIIKQPIDRLVQYHIKYPIQKTTL